MAAGPRYSGWKRQADGDLELYINGTLVATFTATGVTFAVGVTTSGAFTASSTTTLPQAVTIGGIDYTFPADNGDAGEQLQTNGSGVLTWEASGV